ncbi:hypothetical protein BD309DRAFT_867286 [Dichomitus squalens]|uniref:Uncharacterized protein n=2 Tax=Dichomitus squalens TaxID=114155 RepID=A0A4Q9Q2Q5_9APHY|nr:uncharacterized protein DICSQDRAFT_172124 [Dichomitus squalens LYAD-421 SS1]EJF59331.1 hypothetical protein DICSQDRAFT_172124 [Dichomitus squalens LYAD-421 SS1]TBU41976.1 hypothetical protein BD309DRAFT_867286 [Dichomitus squalens]TBU61415.1 hypothetical protein BD310DRAFT_812962 [Dichomitus squalens]
MPTYVIMENEMNALTLARVLLCVSDLQRRAEVLSKGNMRSRLAKKPWIEDSYDLSDIHAILDFGTYSDIGNGSALITVELLKVMFALYYPKRLSTTRVPFLVQDGPRGMQG